MQKPRVTEIQVRMDCNGCVKKLEKSLNGVTGIYDINIDFSQQKITIMGWPDPELLTNAIKKTRKNAIICVQTEQFDDQSTPIGVGAPKGGGAPPPPPPPETTKQPAEQPQAEAAPPPKEQAEPENPSPEPFDPTGHVIYHHPPESEYHYGNRGPLYMNHCYSTYKPSPYLTGYTYPRSPPRYSFYNRPDRYSQDFYSNITSMFSDENPNSCTIV